jgi:hypothetical protein
MSVKKQKSIVCISFFEKESVAFNGYFLQSNFCSKHKILPPI